MVSAVVLAVGMEGALLLAGGGSTSSEMALTFLEVIGGPDQPILVFPTMREQAAQAGQSSAEFLRENGAKNVSVVSEIEFTLADKRKLSAQVFEAKGLWLPGGDQGLFMSRLGADFAKRLFQEAHQRGIATFGTSAGAMLMSDPMIDGWLDETRPKRSPGLGLVPFLVDTHYRERNRQGRLNYALNHWGAQSQGVGLSEREWVLWKNGRVVRASGRPEWLSQSSSSASSD